MKLDELLHKLKSPIAVRPTRRMTQGELENYLDKAADILRGNADHSEFRGYVFALLFYTVCCCSTSTSPPSVRVRP